MPLAGVHTQTFFMEKVISALKHKRDRHAIKNCNFIKIYYLMNVCGYNEAAAMMHIKMNNLKLKDLDNIYIMAQMLAHYFPTPEQFVTGIHELLINAVEHGNLGIGFDTKTQLLRQGRWKEEIARRLALPENADKGVEIRLMHNETECRLVIIDQGQGFAWKDYVGRPMGADKPNGRGLWIAFNSHFDHILFNPAGNEVTCVAEYNRQSQAEFRRMYAA